MGQELTVTMTPTPTSTERPIGPVGQHPPRTRGPIAVLWRIFAGLLIVGGLVWGTYNVVTLLAHEERVENETFAAADVRALDVDSANGSVRIVAADTDEITVRAEISEGLRRTGERREIVDGVLELHATCPSIGSNFCWVRLRGAGAARRADHGATPTTAGSRSPAPPPPSTSTATTAPSS